MELHSLHLADGSVISSGSLELPALQSILLTEKVNTQQDLICGSVFAATLEATLLCREEQPPLQAGERVKLYRGEEKQGIFYVETLEKTGKGMYKITAYDALRLLDKDLSLWLSGLPDWPYTLQTLAYMVCQQCGIELVGQLPDVSYAAEAFSARQITGRMMLGWIAQALGGFFRATPDGEAEFGWYTPTDKVLTPAGEQYYYRLSFTREAYAVKPIDQVIIRSGSADVGTLYPEDIAGENVYVVEGNPLLTAQDSQSLQALAQNLYEKLHPVTYTPCKVVVPASLDISTGQILEIQDTYGRNYTMYVMERRRSRGRDTLCCVGAYERERTQVANRTSFQALSGKVLNLSMDVDGIQAENRDTAGTLSRLELDVGGIRTQVQAQQTEVEGVKTQYSKLSQDSQKLELRLAQMEEMGTDRVETSTGYRFDAEGLWISKSGEAMENKLDNTGMYVRRAGQVILQANADGVEATDVAVRNFLLVGDHARFEDYSDGEDPCRTACFWMGD